MNIVRKEGRKEQGVILSINKLLDNLKERGMKVICLLPDNTNRVMLNTISVKTVFSPEQCCLMTHVGKLKVVVLEQSESSMSAE